MNNHRLRIKKTVSKSNLKIDPEKETAKLDISRLGQGTSRLISCISRLGPKTSQLL